MTGVALVISPTCQLGLDLPLPPIPMSTMRNRKTVTLLGALFLVIVVRTLNRAFHQEPLIYTQTRLHGVELWTHAVEVGEGKWQKLEKRMNPDPLNAPPDDKTDGEKVYHSGNYQAIFLGPPDQPVDNRRGGDPSFQKFASHLPLENAKPIPNAEEYLDVGVRRSPYDPKAEDYQLAIRNTGEPHGILIVRSLSKGRDPELSVSDCLFYAYREYATKLAGPGYPDYRTIQNLKYVIENRITDKESIEVMEGAYNKFNEAQHAKYEPQILIGEFHRWSYEVPRDRETVHALLGTKTMTSLTSMLGNHFYELGHKCIFGLATESIDNAWYIGVLIGTEFGGECLDRDVPDVVQGDKYIQEYKEQQAIKEEEEKEKALKAKTKKAQDKQDHQVALAAGSEAPPAQEVLAGEESKEGEEGADSEEPETEPDNPEDAVVPEPEDPPIEKPPYPIAQDTPEDSETADDEKTTDDEKDAAGKEGAPADGGAEGEAAEAPEPKPAPLREPPTIEDIPAWTLPPKAAKAGH